MKKFKHSGATGDLLYGLALAKHLGGGEFYVHLNQIDWIGQHYYGSTPDPYHQGCLSEADLEYMRGFLEAQPYITQVAALDPKATEITHNLDRFRPLFVGHPGNYVDIYSAAFGITDPETRALVRNTPWLTVDQPTLLEGRTVVINRTARWLPPILAPEWAWWRAEGVPERAVFVGLESEHYLFREATGWDIPWHPTPTMLDLARVIAGAELFIGNQSQALALAIGLGVPQVVCERRRDLPIERNECYFPNLDRVKYF